MLELFITTERNEDCLIVSLNRPASGNSINRSLAEQLAATFKTKCADPSLRSVILTGAGNRFFCTGGDVKAYALTENQSEIDDIFGFIRDLMDLIEALPIPVIAAVNGYALGGGAELALACDLRVMDTTAEIGLPQARLGIIPGWDGIERLLATVGKSATRRLLLFGERIDAECALKMGLVDEVASEGAAVTRALEVAKAMTTSAPQSISAIKEALRNAARHDFSEARSRTRRDFTRLWSTQDHKEAERAFVEKRAPVFTGK